MLDFYEIVSTTKQIGRGRPGPDTKYETVLYPSWNVHKREDLMTRGGDFYAMWNPHTNLWTTDVSDLIGLIDNHLYQEAEKIRSERGEDIRVLSLNNYQSNSWRTFTQYLKTLPDHYKQLDKQVVFANTDLTKKDFASRKLPYSLKVGKTPAFNKLFGTLYDDANLQKIKWAFGSVLSGESPKIQKFYALYGKPGTGKSTVLDLLAKLVEGYHAPVSVSELGRYNSDFALESLKDNPLVGIDHEGDLSRLESNRLLNSIVAHDTMTVNVKFRSKYSLRLQTTIFVATNKPIRITDVKSGLTRRLIDIQPTGILVTPREYDKLVDQMNFELGAIAAVCIDTFEQLGSKFYDDYRSMEMLAKTNHLFDFVQENAFSFERTNYVKRSEAWKLYQAYCETGGIQYPYPSYVFKDLFADYWTELKSTMRIDGKVNREVYFGFKKDVFEKNYKESLDDESDWLKLDENPSIFDRVFEYQPAQLVNKVGALPRKWDDNTTILRDLDTSRLHMVRPTDNLIMIDFDLKNKRGEKSLHLNLEAARTWPPTYAETSKSGQGLHLYYYYDGDIESLHRLYALDIEIKPPVGKFSIRRKLTLCNNHEIATINSGLPLKETGKGEHMISRKIVANEHAMRTLVLGNLARDYHPHTKPSIDFIFAILQEGYDQGLEYDLSDLRDAVMDMARTSTNNSDYCQAIVKKMKFSSDDAQPKDEEEDADTDQIVFYDVEVFPNVFIIAWKMAGDYQPIIWYNPPRARVAELLDYKLIGFNNRMYDNHILYGWLAGDSNEDCYRRSSSIIENRRDAFFAKAYGLSYTDVHSYSSVKQSLKKWELDLGIRHDELDWPWDEPLPEDMWERAGEYCANDVIATEAVHNARHADFQARKILAALSGLRVNDSTRAHVQQIIFGDNREPQHLFNVPDLSEEFPGYVFNKYGFKDETITVDGHTFHISPTSDKSFYRGEFVGEGGYVWAEPGIYKNVAYLDIASMHPTSLVVLNLFGPYTKNFADLKDARVLIKQGRLDEAGEMFGGKLAPYLNDPEEASDLAYALKIALNSVYGYTSTSKYDWAFRDPRNEDNVVAKRGALFMVDLKNALLERGVKPVHFKTDSVKIADCTEEDIQFVKEFGAKYGYDFEVEGIFSRMALINDAVLIGKWSHNDEWYAVGARFAHPYVYKTLFSKEPIEFDDMVESRMVSGGAAIYLEKDDERTFIGRVGTFCPVTDEGGKLIRVKDDKVSSLPGTKDHQWMQAYLVGGLDLTHLIDRSYFDTLVQDSIDEIAKFGDVETFLEGE